MDVEQKLQETYAGRLGAVETSRGDVDAARRTGARMRVRRRLAVGAAAVAVIAVAASGSLVGTGRVSIGPSHSRGEWRELPAAPLLPRAYALGVWTGGEAIVLGGETKPCPDTYCAQQPREMRDGAAYSPQSNSWRRIPPAPVPVGPGDRLVVADGVVVLRHSLPHGSSWFTYEPDHNRWSTIGDVPDGVGDLPSAYGSKVFVPAGRRIAVYDVTSFRWSLLPRDPNQPRLVQRRVTATPYGPVVTGYDSTQPQDGTVSNPVVADVYDGTSWHRLPAMNILGNDWAWAGDRMIDFDSFAHQGMDSRSGPELGGQLDPASGRTSPLPDSALETPEDGWSLVAIGPGGWAACWGLVYDVAGGEAWTLPRPEGALDSSTTAVWVGDSLLVFGGATLGGEESLADTTNKAWLYTP